MRRHLTAALRRYREAADLTQEDAAEALYWGTSKIIRIEQGSVGVTPVDLRALLELYKVTDEALVSDLVVLARDSKKLPWREYKDVYSQASLTLFGYEGAAKFIYKYEPTFIPGLLQTEDYARNLLEGLGHKEEEVDRMVSARLERQKLLDREAHPQLRFILGEAVVERAVGGRGVMRDQLQWLKELAERPGIFLQVMLFAAGAHPRMGGAFTILQFADEKIDDLLYLENAGGTSVSRDDPDLIAEYLQDFLKLQGRASKTGDFARVIDEVLAARFTDPPTEAS
jgi:transcriptional regulator with XRE-family HTH domain